MPLATVCNFYSNTVNFVFDDTPLNIMFNEFKSGEKGHMAFVLMVINDDGDDNGDDDDDDGSSSHDKDKKVSMATKITSTKPMTSTTKDRRRTLGIQNLFSLRGGNTRNRNNVISCNNAIPMSSAASLWNINKDWWDKISTYS
jgi:hypothetical protein